MTSDRYPSIRNPFGLPLGMSPLSGCSASGSQLGNFLSDLQSALTPSPTSSNALASLVSGLGPLTPRPTPQNVLSGLSALGDAARSPLGAPATTAAPSPVRRKVFFSFHYQEDIHRTCIVRQSWRFRPGWQPPSHNIYDKSLWESSMSEGEEALKRLIRRGMGNSSVTCVLAGTWTWSRPFVRYEIAHCLFRKSGLLAVFIHNVRHPQKGTSAPGYDPLAFMGLELREDGMGRVCELVDGQWRPFELMKQLVPWPQWLPKPSVGFLYPLSVGTSSYDYVLDDGHQNLPAWAQSAALRAGRS